MFITALLFLFVSYLFLPGSSDETIHNSLPEESILLEGKIDSQVYLKDSSLTFTMKQKENIKINIRYFYQKDFNEIKPFLKTIETGRVCSVKGMQNPTPPKSNPGQFDYQNYLAQQNIHSEVIVEDLSHIQCQKKSVLTPIWSLRNKLTIKIKSSYSDLSSSWLIALVLGEDSFIDNDIINLFRHWNIAHLLAISGLHTAIFIGIIYFLLLKVFKFTIEKTQISLIFILPVFIILTGAEPSVIRASLMVIIFMLFSLLKIKRPPSDLLSIIFISLIIFKPSLLTHIGFQFSFAVTFSLLISLKWFNQTNHLLFQSFQISFISQMIILPLQIHYFSVFQPLSIFLNVLVIPYFTFMVIPFMFLMLMGIFFPEIIRKLLDHLFVFVHNFFLDFLQALDDLFEGHFVVGDLHLNHFLTYYLIIFILMWALEEKRLKHSIVVGVIFVSFIIFLSKKETFLPEGRVTMLDIGQGDSIIIEQPYQNGIYFMDVGSTFSFIDMEPSNRVYEQVIKPYLYFRGIDTIDGVFLSHDHLDHTGSLEYMLEDFNINEVFISPYHPITKELHFALNKSGTSITMINPVEKIKRGDLSFHVLHPTKDEQDENDNSLIIYTKIGGKSWLFNGDASTHNELDVLKSYPNLSADILKVGHHGSDTSTDEAFLQTVNPDYAFVSAGINNVYGHPTPSVIERLKNHGIEVFRTDEDGAIEYEYNMKTKEASLKRYLK